MIKIGIIGDIGSGKSYVAKQFGYPVFNADVEVSKLYKRSKKCFRKLKKALPKYFIFPPVKKEQVLKAIIDSQKNLKKIVKVIHPEVRLSMKRFEKKHQNKKFIVLDIPLLIENKINKKKDILVFVSAPKKEINKRLKKRINFNPKIINKFRKMQLSVEIKKRKADFVIKNNFKSNFIKKSAKNIMGKILLNA